VRVLLIENDSAASQHIKSLLADMAEVEACCTLVQALGRLQEKTAEIVLLDLGLPDAKGIENCKRLQEAFPELPFVVYSDIDSQELSIEAVQNGAQDYMVKGEMDARMLRRCLRYAIERKQAEVDKVGLERRLRQSQKMEAIGLLAGGVAHDFNNILTLIIGHSELALEESIPTQMAGQRFSEISLAAKRATGLIRQLLVFSREHAGELQPFDLNEAVSQTFRMMSRLLGEDIELVLCLERDLGQVVADPVQIEQVVMNLAINAREAMPDGGRLTIETSRLSLAESHVGNLVEVKEGDYIVLRVEDTGVGMDPETQGRVFEPFFTTKDIQGGTGLGLATVHGIVEQADGYIDIESQAGAGTRFDIYLPLKVAVPVKIPNVLKGKLKQAPRGTETILLVEDEASLLELGQTILQSLGYRVLAAVTPEEAIGEFVDHLEEIDLLVTDVVMPGMNGGELANRLEAISFELKVLYVSGYSPDRLNGMADEGTFIHKPYAPVTLAHKVREILDA
jgi:two-component system, cell cycle sensor histidine kinase and response regulator CckA